MSKIVKGYNQFVNENFHDEELPNIENTENINSEEESSEYIGDRAMKQLADTLGEEAEYNGNTINYDGNKIDYVSEFDGFQINGAAGRHKVLVKNGNIESAIDEVMELVAGVLTEKKKWIKTDPSEKGKYAGRNIGDLEEMKAKLLKKNAKEKEAGEKVPQKDIEKMAELNFALRAKRGHGFKNK